MALADFHSHILPGMDDGAQTPAESSELLSLLAKDGVGTVLLTSHCFPGKEPIDSYLARRKKALGELSAVLPEYFSVFAWAEVGYSAGTVQNDLTPLTVGKDRFLLLEMPYRAWQNFLCAEVLSLILDKNVTVVLAHPERFCDTAERQTVIEQFLSAGAWAQINADSLLSMRTRKKTVALAEKASHVLLGSDCHSPVWRPPHLSKAEKKLRRSAPALFERLQADESVFLASLPEKSTNSSEAL